MGGLTWEYARLVVVGVATLGAPPPLSVNPDQSTRLSHSLARLHPRLACGLPHSGPSRGEHPTYLPYLPLSLREG